MWGELINVRILVVVRWAIVAPVIAAVLGEPGTLTENAATATEEGLNLLPGETMSSRVRREYINNRAARRRVFKQTDLNGDGLVTRMEYVARNGNMTQEELDILFGAFDADGDRNLSRDEFVRHGFLWVAAQDCELDSIQRCDDEFVYFIRAADLESTEESQRVMLCRALQTYFDCMEHEQVTCDITSYSQAVLELVSTYRTVHFCPHLSFSGLLSMSSPDDEDEAEDGDAAADGTLLEPSEVLSSDQQHDANDDAFVDNRPKRAVQLEGLDDESPGALPLRAPSSHTLDDDTCTTSALTSCTASFNKELRQDNSEFCASLSDYRHCVTRHARRCREIELVDVEASLKTWLQIHHRLGMC